MWRFYLLDWRDRLAIVVGVLLVSGFVVIASTGNWRLLPNFGFGLDWRCTWVGKGEPVCIKDPVQSAKDTSKAK